MHSLARGGGYTYRQVLYDTPQPITTQDSSCTGKTLVWFIPGSDITVRLTAGTRSSGQRSLRSRFDEAHFAKAL